ncbi:hypothetical protein ACTXG6_24810 [Pseudonocardia sp. Cha107L01]|uniref:hypothetical protein n=1 Tax=Pseudonocardia sp. Cha107L01 TaxID=3457576 RepID=UPI00403E4165
MRTEEAFDGDGWFRTGDIGRFDALGNLTIVDRKKELIVTSGGKNISPALLESALKESTLIGQACVVGDGRSMITALLVLDPETAPAWARERGLPTVLGELVKTPELLARIEPTWRTRTSGSTPSSGSGTAPCSPMPGCPTPTC